jgi:hypothetical protein
MMLTPVRHCMTNSIRNSALLALICVALRLNCLSATDPGMPAPPQDVAKGGSVENSKHSPVWVLTEYACKKGVRHKTAREGLVSVVMQRGADGQPSQVLGVKGSKAGEVAFIHVLESDCSGEQPTAAQGGASLALEHKVSGEEYFYAVSGHGECLRAFRIGALGQIVPVDMSTKLQDCQNEVRIWSSQAAKWNAQANSADKTKP